VSWISTDSGLESPRFGTAWRDEYGKIHATVYLGKAAVFFDGPDGKDARAVAAVCIEAAEAMERLEAESAALPFKEEGTGDGT
jgi:hypothetical protein